VIVKDTTAPAPDAATLSTVTGECSASVTAPTATDACGGTITGTTTDPTTYDAQGTYTITWRFNDGNTNESTQTQTVIVKDTTAPAPDAATLSTVTGECSASVTAPTAIDACAGTITGTTTDPTTYDAQGTYTITWRFNDGNANESTQTQTVVVNDTIAPSITGPANIAVVDNSAGSCGAFIDPGTPSTADNCGIESVVGVRSDAKPLTDLYPVGATAITWTATDNSGNATSRTQTVMVTNPPPITVITSPVTPQAVNTPVNFTASFSDNAADQHLAVWTFDGAPQAGIVNEGTDTITATHTFTTTGPHTVTLTITDDCGQVGTANGSTLVYAFAAGSGSFVIGDRNASVGNQVTYWGSQWAKLNSLSGGPAPASFKGFANQTSTAAPNCGGTWKTDPGNSSNPPASVPLYVAVFVSSSITKSGSTINGNIPRMVVVKTNSGYDASPGHAGTGTVVAVICQ
jgi:hypothetical protein